VCPGTEEVNAALGTEAFSEGVKGAFQGGGWTGISC
jgi:hypothetical protein